VRWGVGSHAEVGGGSLGSIRSQPGQGGGAGEYRATPGGEEGCARENTESARPGRGVLGVTVGSQLGRGGVRS